MCWIYFLRFKSEVAGVFFKFKNWIENQSDFRIQVLRSDNENTPQMNLINSVRRLELSINLQPHTLHNKMGSVNGKIEPL